MKCRHCGKEGFTIFTMEAHLKTHFTPAAGNQFTYADFEEMKKALEKKNGHPLPDQKQSEHRGD